MIVKGHSNVSEEHGRQSHGGVGPYRVRTLLDSEFKNNFSYVRELVLPTGSSIGIHLHSGDEELYYVVSGEGKMFVDNDQQDVKPGDVVLTESGSTHGLENSGSEDLKIFVVCAKTKR